ncbi:MAG: YihY/virulence factor BrkB family protein, partial [Phycisphaerales bacterium]|nr:YihY/virulence factor BrkB family protein [Phycisphaerales bacterium]
MTRVKEGPLAFIRGVASDFSDDDAMSLAAAVAFYTALSFAPLVLLVWMVGGFLGDQTKNDLLKLFQSQLGPRAADATGAVLDAAQDQPAREWWRWAFSSVMLLVTASGVFAQLQASLNRVWDVQA